MEKDKSMLDPTKEELEYEKPLFINLDASFVFGDNQESGGRDDGGDLPESHAGEEESYDDGY